MARVLVTEKIADGGLDALRAAGHDVDVQTGLSPEQPMKLDKSKAPWKAFAIVWVIVMVTVPPAAFFITYWLTSQ